MQLVGTQHGAARGTSHYHDQAVSLQARRYVTRPWRKRQAVQSAVVCVCPSHWLQMQCRALINWLPRSLQVDDSHVGYWSVPTVCVHGGVSRISVCQIRGYPLIYSIVYNPFVIFFMPVDIGPMASFLSTVKLSIDFVSFSLCLNSTERKSSQ